MGEKGGDDGMGRKMGIPEGGGRALLKETNRFTQFLKKKYLSEETWFWHLPPQLKTNELVPCIIQENIHVFLPL